MGARYIRVSGSIMADYTKKVRKILSDNGFHIARKGKGDEHKKLLCAAKCSTQQLFIFQKIDIIGHTHHSVTNSIVNLISGLLPILFYPKALPILA